jgi:hypothetical protein
MAASQEPAQDKNTVLDGVLMMLEIRVYDGVLDF